MFENAQTSWQCIKLYVLTKLEVAERKLPVGLFTVIKIACKETSKSWSISWQRKSEQILLMMKDRLHDYEDLKAKPAKHHTAGHRYGEARYTCCTHTSQQVKPTWHWKKTLSDLNRLSSQVMSLQADVNSAKCAATWRTNKSRTPQTHVHQHAARQRRIGTGVANGECSSHVALIEISLWS